MASGKHHSARGNTEKPIGARHAPSRLDLENPNKFALSRGIVPGVTDRDYQLTHTLVSRP
jgi:hypothetical protein